MRSYVSKSEIREINRRLYAFDLKCDDEDEEGSLELVIANIIQGYNATDAVAGVPTVVEIKESCFDKQVLDRIQLLDTKSAIIQVNNAMLNNQNKVSFLKQLKDLGYKIMIEINKDDKYFNYAKMLADIIKIDIQSITESVLEQNEFMCKKLAYNVNSAEDYVLAESANIDYYEGEYISSSVDMDIRQNGHSKVNFLEVIKLIQNKATLEQITRVISRDPLLSAQLIRLCNSTSGRVSTVAEAASSLGIKKIERWIYLLQFGKSSDVSEDIIKESYIRADLCKKLTKKYKFKGLKPEEAYMIGLFSTLDILAGRSMNEELVSLNLKKTTEDALIYRDGIGGELLNLVIAYEEANWERIKIYSKRLKVDKETLFKLYFESITLVARIWDELETYGGMKDK